MEVLEKDVKICSRLTIKTPERGHCRSGVFVINFEHIAHLIPSWVTCHHSIAKYSLNSSRTTDTFLQVLNHVKYKHCYKIKTATSSVITREKV